MSTMEAVDLEAGRTAFAGTNEAIQIFATDFLPTFPLGDETQAAFERRLIDDLRRPGGVLITNEAAATTCRKIVNTKPTH
ncbi:MAG TPA: hypothetical protein VJP80_08015 [Candidatus Saccharimonadales bacterium]|nr:hypothetical protein [Candidatus Saccharimonadales bacterium]